LGIAGAGWGTMWANVIASVYSLYLLRSHLRGLGFRDFGANLKGVLAIGLPTAGAQSLAPIAATIVVAFAQRIGLLSVAAVSLLGRVENFVLMYPMAVAGSVQPLVGQLWGAKRVEAAQSVLATARRIAIRWSVVCGGVLVASSALLPKAFSDDASVRALMTTGLWFTPINYAAMSVIMTTGTSLMAIGKAPRGFRVSATFSLLLIPGFIAAFSARWDTLGLFVGQSLAVVLTAFLYLRVARAERLLAGAPAPQQELLQDQPLPEVRLQSRD
jgi:Na+-driven multidrug efflux pump